MNAKTVLIGPDVYGPESRIVDVTPDYLQQLAVGIRDRERKRVRFCAHPGPEDRLHEMFVVYVKETYVRPNMHIGKDESLNLIEGEADFVFFDGQGEIIEVVPMGDPSTGRQFYCRIPESVYHTWVLRSDTVTVHESIPGPFRREDTIFASWSPEETDVQSVEFQRKLEQRVAEFGGVQ